ncbi:MAG: glycosyl hydrolase family 17 [Proteobacteria bacterium]|jgi:exo-beta-1,3-glucanase (GH17 family)|nr:glycosyl hydrolase family 17 [Pseudomonadota bacterium]NCV45465.1 glycosyl hydrolase family 17 [Pseudomonadota bacterium]NCV99300.1 glycosyl hydrolase family 17 [Pseudomonadota bacterium]NCW10678.1 glycosyl hydrolase family 17 [Pseudomonadota bacterium]NCX42096.1 glycosyl hydrolase family 17 [Pseudomonadota bacterium]|tara:strand:- start:146 stop:1396 length:1251 start_codon:yes stop_codon:yes gene_type:complete
MKKIRYFIISLFLLASCSQSGDLSMNKSAKEFIGNPDYPAISYGGYREKSREQQPTINEIKEDLLIMHAQGFRVFRTYDLHHPFAENTLKAIREIKQADSDFEMYVMLGAWIQCKDAFTENPIHEEEDFEGNKFEITEAVRLAQEYPDIVKIIAVGNEAMVHWAWSYHVPPKFVLKWVKYLQELKANGDLNDDLWVTSSDNFASWGGGSDDYHNDDLDELIRSVDFVSMHTYAFHDTHYNPSFWNLDAVPENLDKQDTIKQAMKRAVDYELNQFDSVKKYVHEIDPSKEVHIGETGWSSVASDLYGYGGTEAADEYKLGLYYQMISDICYSMSLTCFYFSAFNEPWKDSTNENGSENHFGLFTVEGKAKYPLWEQVDNGVFNNLTRGGNPIEKTYNGNFEALLKDSNIPPITIKEE